MTSPGLSVVVPVYHSEQSLPLLIERLENVLRPMGRPFEVVLVNDGSTDRSWPVIQQLAEKHTSVRGVNLMRNYGQHSALLCAIRQARFDTIATIDDDLQNPPEELPRMLAELDKGFDVVYGTAEQGQHGMWRNAASWATKRALQGVMGADIAQRASAFRVFRTALRDAFANYRSPSVSIDVLLSWGTTKFSAVTVRLDPRTIGESHYSLRRLVNHAFNMMTGFSTLPLTIASYIGFLFSMIGAIMLVFVVTSYFVNREQVPGFAFLASVIVIFSGAQLFAIGMIGQYLARMHWRSMERPSYVVSERTESSG